MSQAHLGRSSAAFERRHLEKETKRFKNMKSFKGNYTTIQNLQILLLWIERVKFAIVVESQVLVIASAFLIKNLTISKLNMRIDLQLRNFC